MVLIFLGLLLATFGCSFNARLEPDGFSIYFKRTDTEKFE